MENLDLKQGIASPVSCSSCLSGEGRLAVGPPDPSTTLRWRNHGQGGEDSMASDVSRSQSPSRLGWATAPSELMSLHSPSVSSTSTTSTRHFVGGLPSLIGKEVDVRLTATSSEHQQSKLARIRECTTTIDPSDQPSFRRRSIVIIKTLSTATHWSSSPAICMIDLCIAGIVVKSRRL